MTVVRIRPVRAPIAQLDRASAFEAERSSSKKRFWSKVDCSAGPAACWPWTGFTDEDGYGHLVKTAAERRAGGSSSVRAHRIACEFGNGPTTDDKPDALHAVTCATRLCCNPAHLRWGTNAENQRDAVTTCSRRGTRNSQARLTEAQAIDARRRVFAGESRRSIARDLGVTVGCIRHIADGSNWKHLWVGDLAAPLTAPEVSR